MLGMYIGCPTFEESLGEGALGTSSQNVGKRSVLPSEVVKEENHSPFHILNPIGDVVTIYTV